MLWDWLFQSKGMGSSSRRVLPQCQLGIPMVLVLLTAHLLFPPICCWEGKYTPVLRSTDLSSKCHPCMVCPGKESSWGIYE